MERLYSAGLGRSEPCAVGAGRLLQITPQIHILVAVEPIDEVDYRKLKIALDVLDERLTRTRTTQGQ
jgi:hypothetical protein